MKKIKMLACVAIALLSMNLNAQDFPGEPDMNNSVSCDPTTTTWFLGGNSIILPPNFNSPSTPATFQNFIGSDIGTCNNVPFILKANNLKSVFVMPSGRVGIGTSNPSSLLDVSSTANSAVSCSSGNPNGISGFWARTNVNSAPNSYGFVTEGAGNVGRIKSNVSGTLKTLISYSFNPTYNHPQVWIGNTELGGYTKKPTGIYNDYHFAVEGKIVAKSIYVQVANWADYVFESNYKLMPLQEVKNYITKNHHLPDVPSAVEVSEDGLSLGEMNKVLLQKVEELTLYLLQQESKLTELEKEISYLKRN